MKQIVSPITLGHTKRTITPSLERLPFLGKLLWFFIRPSKWRAYFLSIKQQTEERGPVTKEVWESSERYAIVKKIEEILAESCWGEKFSFHPNDPYFIIGGFEAETLSMVGDLCDVEALMEIEDFFDVKFPENFKEFFAGDPTFGDVVTLIEKKASW